MALSVRDTAHPSHHGLIMELHAASELFRSPQSDVAVDDAGVRVREGDLGDGQGSPVRLADFGDRPSAVDQGRRCVAVDVPHALGGPIPAPGVSSARTHHHVGGRLAQEAGEHIVQVDDVSAALYAPAKEPLLAA
jgi:hypothetical protein